MSHHSGELMSQVYRVYSAKLLIRNFFTHSAGCRFRVKWVEGPGDRARAGHESSSTLSADGSVLCPQRKREVRAEEGLNELPSSSSLLSVFPRSVTELL